MVEKRRFMLVENIEKPILVELKELAHRENYVTFEKFNLKNFIPLNLYKKIAKNGLYKLATKGFDKINSRFGLHRLVCSLFSNIEHMEIHHINKIPNINNIVNLLPVTKALNEKLDHSDDETLVKFLQKEYKSSVIKAPKQTLAQNDSIILKVLGLKEKGLKTKKIVKCLKSKIKQTSVYKISKTFFYSKEFLKWLESDMNKPIQELDEKFRKRWERIIEFECL